MKKSIIIFIIPALLLFSCKSKLEKELDYLQTYLDENNIDAEPTSSGLYYIETLAGTGESPVFGSLVTLHYKGQLLDGEVFDSSIDKGEPFEFRLGYDSLIQGWEEGVTYMKEGGKATLIIPSNLAYGTSGSGEIPPYSTLIFELELIDIFN